MAVQWYCAPARGQMDAISAIDNVIAIVPVNESSMPQTRPTGPPLIRPDSNELEGCQFMR